MQEREAEEQPERVYSRQNMTQHFENQKEVHGSTHGRSFGQIWKTAQRIHVLLVVAILRRYWEIECNIEEDLEA
jgi:hypothetical protein